MSVLIVGSMALDTIQTPLGKCTEVLGGSAVYASVSARFFAPVKLIAVVGEDFPSRYISFLQKKRIDISGLTIKKGKTFRWTGKYGWDFSDPQTLSTALNVFAHFNPRLSAEHRNCGYVFLANIDPSIQMNVLKQIRRPRLTMCDTMNYWIENKRKELLKLLRKIDIFLLNESEARQLSGQTNLLTAAKAIQKMGPRKLIIKKGEHGALLLSGDSIFCTPAYLLESIFDPTGAGDTFAGAMIGYLAQTKAVAGPSLRRAIIYGTIMATFTVEDFSLRRLGTIKKTDIAKRFTLFRKQTCF